MNGLKSLAILLLPVLVTAAVGASLLGGGDYDLSWHTIDGGGGTSTGGSFELAGTLGQPDAGAPLTGGDFALVGGFWALAVDVNPPPTCPADLNGDGAVNSADLAILLGAWGPCGGCAADLDGSGDVNSADLAILLGAWGPCA